MEHLFWGLNYFGSVAHMLERGLQDPCAFRQSGGERGRSLLPSVIKGENRRQDPQMARAQKLYLVMRLLSES